MNFQIFGGRGGEGGKGGRGGRYYSKTWETVRIRKTETRVRNPGRYAIQSFKGWGEWGVCLKSFLLYFVCTASACYPSAHKERDLPLTLNPETLNQETLNPETPSPETLHPLAQSPEPGNPESKNPKPANPKPRNP